MARHNQPGASDQWLNWLDLNKYSKVESFDLFDWAQQLIARVRLRAGKGDFLQRRIRTLKESPLEVAYMQPIIPTSTPLRAMTHVDVRDQDWLYGLPGVRQRVEEWDLAHGKQCPNSRRAAAILGPGGKRRWDVETEMRLSSASAGALRDGIRRKLGTTLQRVTNTDRMLDEEILRLAGKHPGQEPSELDGPAAKYLRLQAEALKDLRLQAEALFEGHTPSLRPIQVDGVPLADYLADILALPGDPEPGENSMPPEDQEAMALLVGVAATPFLRVDLRYGNETLKPAFEQWLNEMRARFQAAGVVELAPPKSGKEQVRRAPVLKFTQGALNRWCEQQVLPYLDILILSEIEGRQRPKAADIADALFPNDLEAKGLRIVEKELPALAKLLLEEDTTDRLLNEGAAQRKGIR